MPFFGVSLQHARVPQIAEVTGPAGTIVRKKVHFCSLSLPGKLQFDPRVKDTKPGKKMGHIPLHYAPKPMVRAFLQARRFIAARYVRLAEPNPQTSPGTTLPFQTGEQRGGQNHTLRHTGNHAAEHD